MNIVDSIGEKQMEKSLAQRTIPDFGPGDTVRVDVKVVEGKRERIQAFEGVCIGRRNRGISSTFTVRKMSYGEGVERVFPLYGPQVAGVAVVRRGKVRRAKLYYLRGRTGRAARIAEKTRGKESARAKAREAKEAKAKAAAKVAAKTDAKTQAKTKATAKSAVKAKAKAKTAVKAKAAKK